MPTVLLRLSAPHQAWGLRSRWEEHASAPRPTKSGVLGLVANALGRDRGDDVSDLGRLVFAVRADRPGTVLVDEQTAGGGVFPLTPLTASRPKTDNNPYWYGVPRRPEIGVTGSVEASHHVSLREPVLITKHYLADAAFLAGLTTEDATLADRILQALRRPSRLLFLGRRSCPPAHPVGHGLTPHGPGQWPHCIPLLPEATDSCPRLWTEAPAGPGSEPSPEQAPTTFAARDHRLLHLRTTRTAPPIRPENSP
ncbi:type I-E CRISPR-associated protein Cas5/CasD (plasmid) [Streptomyces sp. NBC_00445]|uniref:type I-E CRISPR-associated protein Cas5/CasD n=1 Tax=Streptomyces sp. NBC_00445 TaxID=2975745 RepID=UPI002E2202F1